LESEESEGKGKIGDWMGEENKRKLKKKGKNKGILGLP
jgi:hypothetical protein